MPFGKRSGPLESDKVKLWSGNEVGSDLLGSAGSTDVSG